MRRLVQLCSLVLLLSPGVASAGEVKQFTIANGRVTLIADAVPVRTLLQEWARVGQIKIINAEKVQGPPLTLQLIDVPEDQALDIVLRSASGYLAAPREGVLANASRFDRIVILATSRPTTTAAAAPPPQQQAQPPSQTFPAQPVVQPPVGDDQDESDEARPDDQQPPPPPPGVAPRPGPIQVTPNPNAPQGQQPPQGPVTSPRPGLIQPPPPQQPQQPQPPPNRPIP